MRVKLSKWQSQVLRDNHRFKVVCAGRRAGKSVLSRMIVLGWAIKERGIYWIVSPTYKQSEMIHWRDIQKEIPKKWIRKIIGRPYLSIELINGSIIELKGAENPDTLRGVKLRGLVIDEIASIRNWDWLWLEVLRPTLTDYEAPTIFISTPKGFNHFHKLYELGQVEGSYKSWRFTSYDNNFIPKGEIDQAKAELTEDTFAQEYMADFRKYTGLVYKGFDRSIHVIEPFDVDFSIYRCLDFGSTNPTVCLWVGVDDDDNWFIIDEHYLAGKTIDYHAGIINSNTYSKSVVSSYGDPSGAQWIKEFQERGIYITPATRESGTNQQSWVRLRIEKVAERLKSSPGHFVEKVTQKEKGNPSLFVFKNCQNTINEFETYRWKEKSVTQAQDLNEPDVPEKANDHAMDALGYFAVSYKKTSMDQAPPDQARFGRVGEKSFRIGL